MPPSSMDAMIVFSKSCPQSLKVNACKMIEITIEGTGPCANLRNPVENLGFDSRAQDF